ncbi:hypothetical protein RFI_24333, partial [Reticulomyxa filosa]
MSCTYTCTLCVCVLYVCGQTPSLPSSLIPNAQMESEDSDSDVELKQAAICELDLMQKQLRECQSELAKIDARQLQIQCDNNSNSNSNSNGNGNDNSKHDGNAELLALTQQREKLTAELRIVCNNANKKKYKKKVLTQPSLRSSSLASLAVVNHIRSDDFIPLTNVLRRMIEKQFPIFQTVEHIILDLQ